MTEIADHVEAAEGFETLKRHYRDPLLGAKAAGHSGQGAVGLTGATIPVELVLAAGRFPVRISPKLRRPTPAANLYMDDVIAPRTKALFEDAIDGDLAFLDLLVLSRADDKLYYYLKEMVRLGRAPRAPRLQMFDLMGSRRDSVRAYNLHCMDDLIAALERVGGQPITDDAIRGASALTNRSRGLQRRLIDQRWAGKVAGSDALQAIGAGYFMHPAPYAEALEVYVRELEAEPPRGAQGPRVLVSTSEPFSHLGLHKRLEAAGAVVVAEDDLWGARAPGGDVSLTGSPREAMLEKYWLDTAHGGVYPPQEREAWLMAHIGRGDVDGVVFYVPPSDRQFGWDYPRLATAVAAQGKPSALFRQDAGGDDSIDSDIAAFVARLDAKGGPRP